MSTAGNKHVLRSERTRAQLVAAARELFLDRGYAHVSTEEVVRRAGVTRGALYHHFEGKRDLFLAIFEEVEGEFIAALAETVASAAPTDPLGSLRAGVDATLEATSDPAFARLTLLDAPAILGWEQWRELSARYGLGVVRAGLTAAVEAGLVEGPVDPLAQLMLAAVEEAVLYVARSDDPQSTRHEARTALHALLDGLAAAGGK
jgi:AcrR family transcriptional regulator